MKARLSEAFMLGRYSRNLPSPVPKVRGVFSLRDVPSISERHLRATAVAYIVLGVAWTTLTNRLHGSLSCLVLEFLLDSLWFLWDHCQPKWHKFI